MMVLPFNFYVDLDKTIDIRLAQSLAQQLSANRADSFPLLGACAGATQPPIG